MATSNLILTSTANMSPAEWLGFRKRGIGASEVGAIMGLSQYKSNVELFYEKIGQGLGYNIENIAMFMGTELEDFIARMWQYWGGTEASLIENFRTGNMVRRMQRVNAYIQNPKYPHLFVSLDRRINKHIDTQTGKERGNGALEIKTISGYEADKWETGIPPSHVVQVQTQLVVTGWQYGELAVFKDGRFFDVYPYEKHKGVCREIVKQTTDFWKRVERARIILTQQFEAEKNFNLRKVKELEAELQTLEPAPDASDGLAQFLKEKFRNAEPTSERYGTLEELATAQEHAKLKAKRKSIDERLQLCENSLKSTMKTTEKLVFPQEGFVSWKNDASGSRRFVNKIIIS